MERIEQCEKCEYYTEYNWEGKSERCRHPEMLKRSENSLHGKAIEREEWEDIPDFCPLEPRKK